MQALSAVETVPSVQHGGRVEAYRSSLRSHGSTVRGFKVNKVAIIGSPVFLKEASFLPYCGLVRGHDMGLGQGERHTLGGLTATPWQPKVWPR